MEEQGKAVGANHPPTDKLPVEDKQWWLFELFSLMQKHVALLLVFGASFAVLGAVYQVNAQREARYTYRTEVLVRLVDDNGHMVAYEDFEKRLGRAIRQIEFNRVFWQEVFLRVPSLEALFSADSASPTSLARRATLLDQPMLSFRSFSDDHSVVVQLEMDHAGWPRERWQDLLSSVNEAFAAQNRLDVKKWRQTQQSAIKRLGQHSTTELAQMHKHDEDLRTYAQQRAMVDADLAKVKAAMVKAMEVHERSPRFKAWMQDKLDTNEDQGLEWRIEAALLKAGEFYAQGWLKQERLDQIYTQLGELSARFRAVENQYALQRQQHQAILERISEEKVELEWQLKHPFVNYPRFEAIDEQAVLRFEYAVLDPDSQDIGWPRAAFGAGLIGLVLAFVMLTLRSLAMHYRSWQRGQKKHHHQPSEGSFVRAD